MKIYVTPHAVRRYAERVRTGIHPRWLKDELEAIANASVIQPSPPAWLTPSMRSSRSPLGRIVGYIMIEGGSAALCVAVDHDGRADFKVTTVVRDCGNSITPRGDDGRRPSQ